MHACEDLSLLDFFQHVFLVNNLNLSEGAATNYRVAINHLTSFHRTPVMCRDLSDDLLLRFMRHLNASGTQSARTINNKRCAIKTIWAAAARKGLAQKPGVIGKFSEPKRIVRAWSVAQVAQIIEAARFAPTIRHWDYRHWRFLILLIYDTSHRVRALLQTPWSALSADGYLLVLAEHAKGHADKLHKVHAETLAAFRDLPPSKSGLLIDWPLSIKEIWPRFKLILKAAGLPATRRDLFHKLRRTSYTYVYALLGQHAASDHAAHTTDLSRVYLDVTLMNEIKGLPAAIDVLPRPTPR